MKTYRLSAPITVTAWTEVRARNMEEAKKIAAQRSAVIGAPGSGYDTTEHWIVDDADGEVDPAEITSVDD